MTKQYALVLAAGLAAGSIAYAGDCPGDCNGDGNPNILDFVCFQGLFQNGDPSADCNDDGNLNILDFVCYQAAFQDFVNGGCKGGGDLLNDNFDSYSLGSICGQGGWTSWDGNPDVCGEVSNEQSFSPDQSLKIIGATGVAGDDTVHEFDVSGGQWTFTCQTFVPDDAAGTAWIILLNTYVSGDPNAKNWSLQVRLDADLGTVESDFDGGLTLLTTGEWVEFRAEIDIDADTQDYFYGGEQFVFGKSWVDGVSGGGSPTLQAIDLYGDEPTGAGTTGTYFDDVVIAPGIN